MIDADGLTRRQRNLLALANGLQIADHMEIMVEGAKTVMEFRDTPLNGRTCGSCTACCRLLPVEEISKKAGERCKHQRHGKGCSIYPKRPFSCRAWSCRWLAEQEAHGLRRPDRAHYIVDMAEDTVIADDDNGKPHSRFPVLQVWVDPAYPDAHRAPELREYLRIMGEKHGLSAIIRYDSQRAFTLFPPAVTGGDWVEMGGEVVSQEEIETKARSLGP